VSNLNSVSTTGIHSCLIPPPADKQSSFFIAYGANVDKWVPDFGMNYAEVEIKI